MLVLPLSSFSNQAYFSFHFFSSSSLPLLYHLLISFLHDFLIRVGCSILFIFAIYHPLLLSIPYQLFHLSPSFPALRQIFFFLNFIFSFFLFPINLISIRYSLSSLLPILSLFVFDFSFRHPIYHPFFFPFHLSFLSFSHVSSSFSPHVTTCFIR